MCDEDVDECVKLFCGIGICENFFGLFICECLDGLKGDMCEDDIDECLKSFC